MADDLDEQANELLVLKSIYGDDAIILNEPSCASAFSIEVDIELDAPLTVSAAAAAAAAPPPAKHIAKRAAPDGCLYTQQEFEDFFGSLYEWTGAIDTQVLEPSPPVQNHAGNHAGAGPSNNDGDGIAQDPRQLVECKVKLSEASVHSPPAVNRSASSHVLSAVVSHLPPLTLSLVLPADYPSRSPPALTLSCLWLDVYQLTKLILQLEQLWADECFGCTCIFRWAEWLRHEAMQSLEIGASITLTAGGCGDSPGDPAAGLTAADPRALSECSAQPEADLDEIVRYDWESNQAKWHAEVVTCPICLVRGCRVSILRPACMAFCPPGLQMAYCQLVLPLPLLLTHSSLHRNPPSKLRTSTAARRACVEWGERATTLVAAAA